MSNRRLPLAACILRAPEYRQLVRQQSSGQTPHSNLLHQRILLVLCEPFWRIRLANVSHTIDSYP